MQQIYDALSTSAVTSATDFINYVEKSEHRVTKSLKLKIKLPCKVNVVCSKLCVCLFICSSLCNGNIVLFHEIIWSKAGKLSLPDYIRMARKGCRSRRLEIGD